MEACCVGLNLQEECHKHQYTTEEGLKSCEELSDDEREILRLRTNVSSIEKVCYHHLKIYMNVFEERQRVCCDPFKKHHKSVKKSLKPVSLDFSKGHSHLAILIPGTKLCITCRKLFKSPVCCAHGDDTNDDESRESDADYQPDDPSFVFEQLNQSCELMNSSPLKISKRRIDERPDYLKNKAQRIAQSFTEKASKVLGIEIVNSEEETIQSNCSDCETLMEKLRVKFNNCSVNEKVQILTLAPDSWSQSRIATYFQTTNYLVKKAKTLLREDGILAIGNKKKGRLLSTEAVNQVKEFYYDDDISRICSNARDCVSVPSENGKRELKTKRLILLNLKEIFILFKEKNPEIKIGFTKFCELRPKECVTVSSRGIHSVCVCTYHQNVKLMMHSINLKMDYKELLLKLVCSLDSEECMIHRCVKCPNESELHNFLMQLETLEAVDNIIFKQWVHTDRSVLDTLIKPVDDFVDMLVKKLKILTQHHYIAKAQSNYLKTLKLELNLESCIIVADFAENYTCILQDAAQGFHWHNIQVTVHPFVIYYRIGDELKSLSMCFISNCLKHDTTTFFVFQRAAICHLISEVPNIRHAIYFSDGSAAQYKNFKNFVNLCHHQEDHGITAEWHFFATSHGKNACDGVGGTVKRLATRASLQRTNEHLILSAHDLYTFASEHIKGIKTFYISSDAIAEVSTVLEERYSRTHTLPGSRENHSFVPLDATTLLVKRVSNSNKSFRAVIGRKSREEMLELKGEQFVALLYDRKWWVGKILEYSTEERDAKIQFMHPSGPSASYVWPHPDDICWVPYENIIVNVPIPDISSFSGRNYKLSDYVTTSIEKALREMEAHS